VAGDDAQHVSHLRIIDPIGPELLRRDAASLIAELGGPTLARLPGTGIERPRAIVVLQHGDERTGLDALLDVLRGHPPLPYDLHLLFGNVEAALEPPGFAHRMLPHQSDMNRAWFEVDEPGAGHDSVSGAAREALVRLRALGLSALVDLPNTTGENPFHAIVATDDPANVGLAALFTPLVVRWDQHLHTLMEGLRGHCVAATIECGRVGSDAAHAFAVSGLRRFLAEPAPDALPIPDGIHFLSRMRRVIVDPTATLAFGGRSAGDPRLAADVVVAAGVEERNGIEQRPGWLIASVRPGHERSLRVVDTDGTDVTDELLVVDRGEVHVRAVATPLMMTRTVAATRADCLTYLLERAEPPASWASWSVSSASSAPATAAWPASHAATSSPANRSSSGTLVGTSDHSSS
jgi:succinylglutamate desuccinylase